MTTERYLEYSGRADTLESRTRGNKDSFLGETAERVDFLNRVVSVINRDKFIIFLDDDDSGKQIRQRLVKKLDSAVFMPEWKDFPPWPEDIV